MTVNNRFRISWKHNNESAKKYLSSKELREAAKEIISSNNSRIKSMELIDNLLASQEEFTKSFSRCFIEDLERDVKYEGVTVLHPRDHFNRKIGMEMSFKDAISNIENQSIRVVLWRAFLTEHKKGVKLKKVIDIDTKVLPKGNGRGRYNL